MGHPFDVEHATRLHVEWSVALAERAGLTTTHQAAPQMRAVMMELRDSLAPEAVLTVANALPALERGIFLEGWSLDYTPRPPASAASCAAASMPRAKPETTVTPRRARSLANIEAAFNP